MAEQENWEKVILKDSIMEIKLKSWEYFHDYIIHKMLEYSHYIWRGQRDSSWALTSSLDRLIEHKDDEQKHLVAKNHLDKFKMAARGRRGPNPVEIPNDDEWWALGQHQGLATPLLDWTESPFVALYFAFEKIDPPASGQRCVWSLGSTEKKIQRLFLAQKIKLKDSG